MPYTLQDYVKDLARKYLDELSAEKRPANPKKIVERLAAQFPDLLEAFLLRLGQAHRATQSQASKKRR